jgi:hypothetical protein
LDGSKSEAEKTKRSRSTAKERKRRSAPVKSTSLDVEESSVAKLLLDDSKPETERTKRSRSTVKERKQRSAPVKPTSVDVEESPVAKLPLDGSKPETEKTKRSRTVKERKRHSAPVKPTLLDVEESDSEKERAPVVGRGKGQKRKFASAKSLSIFDMDDSESETEKPKTIRRGKGQKLPSIAADKPKSNSDKPCSVKGQRNSQTQKALPLRNSTSGANKLKRISTGNERNRHSTPSKSPLLDEYRSASEVDMPAAKHENKRHSAPAKLSVFDRDSESETEKPKKKGNSKSSRKHQSAPPKIPTKKRSIVDIEDLENELLTPVIKTNGSERRTKLARLSALKFQPLLQFGEPSTQSEGSSSENENQDSDYENPKGEFRSQSGNKNTRCLRSRQTTSKSPKDDNPKSTRKRKPQAYESGRLQSTSGTLRKKSRTVYNGRSKSSSSASPQSASAVATGSDCSDYERKKSTKKSKFQSSVESGVKGVVAMQIKEAKLENELSSVRKRSLKLGLSIADDDIESQPEKNVESERSLSDSAKSLESASDVTEDSDTSFKAPSRKPSRVTQPSFSDDDDNSEMQNALGIVFASMKNRKRKYVSKACDETGTSAFIIYFSLNPV